MRALLLLRLAQLARHIPNFLRLFWRLVLDRRVSPIGKALLLLIPAYLFLIVDLIPDFIGISLARFGYMDDVLVAYLVLRGFIALCPPKVVAEHVAKIEAESRPSIS